MAKRLQNAPLQVYLNNHRVGQLLKNPSGAIEFQYSMHWLDRHSALPVSLSLPLREEAYRGEAVVAVFENLLPDSNVLRRHVAEKVGASGMDAYSLLAMIGHDCVGALQFIASDDEDSILSDGTIRGEVIDEEQIERLLNNLAQTPLGLQQGDDFRISVAGAQEKTALLWYRGQWLKPHGATPTSHIFKTQMGQLPSGLDLTNSVENEYYCLSLAAAFGLPVNATRIMNFGNTKALVIERFDRQWTEGGRLLRLPQEDFCQALSVPPTRKYQADSGPGMIQILDLLKASDTPAEDQKRVLIAQMLFWIIGATDGHAKNFSVFLSPGGGFRMTPLYDILTAQPSFDRHEIQMKQMKLAMSVGKNRHYRIDQIHPRHFVQTAAASGIPESIVRDAMAHIITHGEKAFDLVEQALPKDFPEALHESVRRAAIPRIQAFETMGGGISRKILQRM